MLGEANIAFLIKGINDLSVQRIALFPMLFVACTSIATAAKEVPIPTLAVSNANHELRAGKEITLDVWMKYRGELELHDSRVSRDLSLLFPYCISAGLGPALGHMDVSKLDNRLAQVRGKLFTYQSPQSEQNSIQTFTAIEGMSFKNWCLGPYVMQIDEVKFR